MVEARRVSRTPDPTWTPSEREALDPRGWVRPPSGCVLERVGHVRRPVGAERHPPRDLYGDPYTGSKVYFAKVRLVRGADQRCAGAWLEPCVFRC